MIDNDVTGGRKLASIRRIAEIRPIPGADQIVCAVVDGWELVTNKENGFSVGDLVVYFEVDSVLPEREEFEFLRERCYVNEKQSVHGAGFRLKTIKLRGQYSQGLILPLVDKDSVEKMFIEDLKGCVGIDALQLEGSLQGEYFIKTVIDGAAHFHDAYEGRDVTELLGVVKFEKPLPSSLGGVARGNFPTFIPKTDADRVQNSMRTVQDTPGPWEMSIKLDGTSFTAYLYEGRFGVCSRNLDLQETDGNAYWEYARRVGLEEKMRAWFTGDFAIQGELIGPGIQGNKENLSQTELYVFNVYNITERHYLTPGGRRLITPALGLKEAPVLEQSIDISKMTVQEIIALSEGPSLNAKLREGVVFKSHTDPSKIIKAISPKWLIKNDG